MAARDRAATTITTTNDLEFVIDRVLEAPRRLVFEAMSKPEHVRRWWGPRNYTLSACEMDFRVGGRYRYLLRAPDGSEAPFKGEYREIVPPERLVYTQIYDVAPFSDLTAVVTTVLREENGKTRLTSTITHDSREHRDGHLSGREGMIESMERFAELLDELRASR